MKKRFLFLALLTLSIINFANAEKEDYIFQVNRKGGELVTTHTGFLGLIHNQYVGFKTVEYRTVENIVYVNCLDEGVNRCRVTTPDGKTHTFSVGKNNFYFQNFDIFFDKMLLEVEDAISAQKYTGESIRKISTTSIEGIEITIAFTLIWQLDYNGDGTITMYAKEIQL